MSNTALRRLGGMLVLTVGFVMIGCVVDNGGSGGGGSTATGGSTGGAAPNGPDKVGVACTPGDENSPFFPGFAVTEDVIIQGAPECGTGVCLVNHFQGDVSCPLGQAAPVDAQGVQGCVPMRDMNGNYVADKGSCNDGDICMQAGSRSPSCDLSQGQENADKFCAGIGAGGHCAANGVCECKTDADCLFVTDQVVSCDSLTHQCIPYACHKPGDCQVAGATAAENAGKACCVPGTDTPVTKQVCGQCTGQNGQHTRDADSAVYCTCRCGVADGEPDDPDYPFCACPDGFECSEVRKNYGLGDASITGKYCIKQGTAYDPNQDQCGLVDGHWEMKCGGVASGNN